MTPPRREPPSDPGPHGSQQPPILPTPTTNQLPNSPLPPTNGRLQRQVKAPTRCFKQSRSSISTTRLRPGRRRQPKCHGPPGPPLHECNKPCNAPRRHLPIAKRPPHDFSFLTVRYDMDTTLTWHPEGLACTAWTGVSLGTGLTSFMTSPLHYDPCAPL